MVQRTPSTSTTVPLIRNFTWNIIYLASYETTQIRGGGLKRRADALQQAAVARVQVDYVNSMNSASLDVLACNSPPRTLSKLVLSSYLLLQSVFIFFEHFPALHQGTNPTPYGFSWGCACRKFINERNCMEELRGIFSYSSHLYLEEAI